MKSLLVVNVLAPVNVYAHVPVLVRTYNKMSLIAYIGLTSECSLRCRPCHHFQIVNKDANHLTSVDLLHFIKVFGVPSLVYLGGGGEPTMSNYYLDISGLLIEKNVTVITITNGLYLHKALLWNDLQMEKMQFIFSIPSARPNIYSLWTGVYDGDKALKTIRSNCKCVSSVDTIIQTTLTKNNGTLEDILSVIDFAYEVNIRWVRLQIASPTMNGDNSCYLKEQDIRYISYMLKKISVHANNKHIQLLHSESDNKGPAYTKYHSNAFSESKEIVLQENGSILCCCSPNSKSLGVLAEITNPINDLAEFKHSSGGCGRC